MELRYKCKNCEIEVCKFCLVKAYENQLVEIETQVSRQTIATQDLEIERLEFQLKKKIEFTQKILILE